LPGAALAISLGLFNPCYGSGDVLHFTSVGDPGIGDTNSAHGMLAVDYNGDGWVDIYVINKKRNESRPFQEVPYDNNFLYRNNGDGTFTDVTVESGAASYYNGHGGVFLDYDNDGDLDLFIANWNDTLNDPNELLRNNGDGTFTKVNSEAGLDEVKNGMSHDATALDFNNDGFLDIVATDARDTTMLLLNNGDGTFTDVAGMSGLGYTERPHTAIGVDYDNDGDVDIYIPDWPPRPNHLYRNNGDGAFTDVAAEAGIASGEIHSAYFVDLNGDGFPDLIAPNSDTGDPSVLFINNRDGTFRDITAESGIRHPPARTHAMLCADFDYDGDMDVFMPDGGGNSLFFENLGDGTFREITSQVGLSGVPYSKGSTVLDYDNDGDLDICLAVNGSPNLLYANDGGPNHWLKVRLAGTESNSFGVNAKVKVVSDGIAQVREMFPSRGHQQDPYELAFGLGEATSADSLIVLWPSGNVDVFVGVMADQGIRIVEGSESYDVYQLRAYAEPQGVPGDGETPLLVSVPLPSLPGPHNVRINLSPIGGPRDAPMYDDGTNGDASPGDGIYTVRTTVDPFIIPGVKVLGIEIGYGGSRKAVSGVQVMVYPSADFYVYRDGLSPGWDVSSGNTEVDLHSTDLVYDGSYSCAITLLNPVGSATYLVSAPSGFQTFGYEKLEFEFNPGSSSLMEVMVGKIALGRDLGIDLKDPSWQTVSIPLDEIESSGTLRSINLSIYGSGTFYLDNLRMTLKGTLPSSVSLWEAGLPSRFELFNYPNPFNSRTVISYSVPSRGRVEIGVYDLLGRRVRLLRDGPVHPGRHAVFWDGRDDGGRRVSSGVYVCVLRSDSGVRTRRMVLLK